MAAKMGELQAPLLYPLSWTPLTLRGVCAAVSSLLNGHNLVSVTRIELCHKDRKEKAQNTLP